MKVITLGIPDSMLAVLQAQVVDYNTNIVPTIENGAETNIDDEIRVLLAEAMVAAGHFKSFNDAFK